MSFTDSVPDFIPDEVQTVHLDEARHRLRQTPPSPSGFAHIHTPADLLDAAEAPAAPAAPARRTPVTTVAAALIGVPGVLAMTAVWAWLAVTRPSPVWWSLTALGGLLTLVGVVSVVRIVAATRAARSQASAAQHPQPQVMDGDSMATPIEYRDAA